MSRLQDVAALLVGTGLGAGYSPVAPGTAGSLVGLALFAALAAAGGQAAATGGLVALLPVAWWASRECGARFGHHDHRRIVVDEVAGMVLTLLTFPAHPAWLAAGFLAFRFFDIVKPPPARRLDREWHSAAGNIADDLVAGVYANLTLQAARVLLRAQGVS